ncbi:MAG: CinA family nicotinamide mononucleotide deamidase-related protein, partial [Acidobacteriota bacterium]
GISRAETNSVDITRVLDRHGVEIARKSTVPDHETEIAAELNFALDRCDVVLLTGGAGPTEDDRTIDAVSSALGIPLVEDADILSDIEAKFSLRSLKMPAVNRKQARIFAGHRALPNPRGTAPGFHIIFKRGNHTRHVWIFPGVPWELEEMLETQLGAWLEKVSSASGTQHRTIKIVGLTESAVEQSLRPFYERHPEQPVTLLAALGEVHLHLLTRGSADDGYSHLMALEGELREIFGERIFGLDDETLESTVGRLLSARGETLGTAESCTGGLLASRITDVSGSSAYFLGGVITYSFQAKLFLLGVDPASIERHGEVSEEVARQMAEGARRRFSTTYGVGITGIAGPTGGTASKPVGTVHVAVSSLEETRHKQFLLAGSRELIKRYSTQLALDMLRMMMIPSKPDPGLSLSSSASRSE